MDKWFSKNKVHYGQRNKGEDILCLAGISNTKYNAELITKTEYERYCEESGLDPSLVHIVRKSRSTPPPLLTDYLASVRNTYEGFPLDVLQNGLSDELRNVASAADAQTVERVEVVRTVREDEGGGGALHFSRYIPYASKEATPLADLFDPNGKNKQRVVVFGPPGEGKSTLLRKQTLSWLNDAENPVTPVVVLLKDWEKYGTGTGELRRHLQNIVLPNHGLDGEEATAFLNYCKTNQAAVAYVFDGLDETADPDAAKIAIELWAKDYPNSRILVTCRSAADNHFFKNSTLPFYRAELQPLTPDAIKAYVNRCIAGVPEDKKEQGDRMRPLLDALDPARPGYDPRTLALASSGICLAMMLSLLRRGAVELPTSRDDLYHKLVRDFLMSNKQQCNDTDNTYYADVKRCALEEMAFWYLFFPHDAALAPTAGRLNELLQKHAQTLQSRLATHSDLRENIVEDMTVSGGLIQKDAHGRLSFFHLTLIEYFAAGYIVRQWREARAAVVDPRREPGTLHKWLPQIWQAPANEDARPWLETHVPEIGDKRVGRLPFFRNLPFDPKYREMLLLMVGQFGDNAGVGEAEQWEAWWLNGLMRAPYMYDFVLQCLSRCRCDHSGLQTALTEETVLETLMSVRISVRFRYEKWDGFNAINNARHKENKGELLRLAIGVAREYKKEVSKNRIIEVTMNELFARDDEEKVNPFFNLKIIRAIQVLSQISVNNKENIELLKKIAREDTIASYSLPLSYLRRATIEALAHLTVIHDTDTIALLKLIAYQDNYFYVRIQAIRALAKSQPGVSDNRTIELLIKIARQDESLIVRIEAIQALARLGVKHSRETIESLKKIARENKDDFRNVDARTAAIQALAQQGINDEEITILLEQIAREDEDCDVSRMAFRSVADLGVQNDGFIKWLIQTVREDNFGQNGSAVIYALARLGVNNKEIVKLLEHIVKEDHYLFTDAIEALSLLQNKTEFENTIKPVWDTDMQNKKHSVPTYVWAAVRLPATKWMFHALDRIHTGDHFTADEKPDWIKYIHDILFNLAAFAPEKVEDAEPLPSA